MLRSCAFPSSGEAPGHETEGRSAAGGGLLRVGAMVVVGMLLTSDAEAGRASVPLGCCVPYIHRALVHGAEVTTPLSGPHETVIAFYTAFANLDAQSLRRHSSRELSELASAPWFRLKCPDDRMRFSNGHLWLGMRASVAARFGDVDGLHIVHLGPMQEASVAWGKVTLHALMWVSPRKPRAQEWPGRLVLHRFDLERAGVDNDECGTWHIVRWTEELGEPDATGVGSDLVWRGPAREAVVPVLDEDLPLELAFARAAAEPGPILSFALALPRATEVTLSLIDVQGRVQIRRRWTELGGGRHTLRLAEHEAPPGIYWARLHAGAEQRDVRVTLVR